MTATARAARVFAELRRRLVRRGRVPGIRTAKTTLAATLAFVIARPLSGQSQAILAALTALLVVQVTLHETFTSVLQRVGSVVAGVLLAVGVSFLTGLTWWSLAIVIALALVLGRLLRLGPQLLEAPISAMLVLAVGGQQGFAADRIYATLIGAAVGVVTSFVLAPPLYLQPAGDAIGELADRVAEVLRRIADDVEQGWSPELARGWLDAARSLGGEVVRAERALDRATESARMHPRRRRAAVSGPSLRSALAALEHVVVLLRGVSRALSDRVQATAEGGYGEQMRAGIADELRAVAEAVGAFGRLVAPDVTLPTGDDAELRAALARARTSLEALRPQLAVDPMGDLEAWGQHGTLLSNLDRLLREIDPDAGLEGAAVRRTPLPPRRTPPTAMREMVRKARPRVESEQAPRRVGRPLGGPPAITPAERPVWEPDGDERGD